MSFIDFEHKLVKHIRKNFKDFSGQEVIVACSGGADSVGLFRALNKIKALLGVEVKLLHIHHGEVEDKKQEAFRDEASSFCKKLAAKYNCDFLLEASNKKLVSEEDCRDFRQTAFEKHKNVFLAQHKDDFTETLLLRLIRGTGPQGLSSPFSKNLHRPFLEIFHRLEVLDYLNFMEQDYVEDPSNKNDQYLRNWLRNDWLPILEKKRGIKGLATSLQLISDELSSDNEKEEKSLFSAILFTKDGGGHFQHFHWLNLNKYQKQSTIAHILLKTLKVGYTKGHIDEVVKSLDLREKTTTFKSGGLGWSKEEDKVFFNKL